VDAESEDPVEMMVRVSNPIVIKGAELSSEALPLGAGAGGSGNSQQAADQSGVEWLSPRLRAEEELKAFDAGDSTFFEEMTMETSEDEADLFSRDGGDSILEEEDSIFVTPPAFEGRMLEQQVSLSPSKPLTLSPQP
jgi:hypothetical protein